LKATDNLREPAMWSLRAWRRQRILARHPISSATWASVCDRLPILDGLEPAELQRLRERAVLFLHHKHLSALPGLELSGEDRLLLALQAELPLLNLADLDWYQGFHEIVLYPDDFVSPQRHRDASGVVHEWDGAHSGEAWQQGPVILAWPGVEASGQWDGYNLVIHELAHKLDMLNGDANGLPPLHRNMRISDWAEAMQSAFDQMNAELDANPEAETALDPYAAENPAEFFAVTSEYFFSAPDLLAEAFPAVYAQLALFYRQAPLMRLKQLQARHPDYQVTTNATNG
jgi:MtfA peptidase